MCHHLTIQLLIHKQKAGREPSQSDLVIKGMSGNFKLSMNKNTQQYEVYNPVRPPEKK